MLRARRQRLRQVADVLAELRVEIGLDPAGDRGLDEARLQRGDPRRDIRGRGRIGELRREAECRKRPGRAFDRNINGARSALFDTAREHEGGVAECPAQTVADQTASSGNGNQIGLERGRGRRDALAGNLKLGGIRLAGGQIRRNLQVEGGGRREIKVAQVDEGAGLEVDAVNASLDIAAGIVEALNAHAVSAGGDDQVFGVGGRARKAQVGSGDAALEADAAAIGAGLFDDHIIPEARREDVGVIARGAGQGIVAGQADDGFRC